MKADKTIRTNDMSHEEWLEYRRHSIGGSDAGALLGLNRYTSPYALWAEKTGKVIPEDISDKEAVRLGNDLEQYVAERFMEETGKRVHRCNAILYNSSYPFAHANPDRIVAGEDAGLECKTTSSWEVLQKCRNGEYPDTWYAQCTHYMMVTGAERWYLGVLCFGHGFYWFEIPRNEDEIAALAAAEASFWELVESDTPPQVDGTESTTEAIRTIYADSYDKQCDLMPVETEIRQYLAIKKQIAELTELMDEQKNKICDYMGEAERGECAACTISWKTQTRRTFDAKKFAKNNPNIDLTAYYKESSSRPMKITERS